MVTFDAHNALFGCCHLGCIAMMLVASSTPIPFSASCNDCLSCFFVPPVGFMCIFTLMRLWTSDPNLHLSLADTAFCLLSCLFTFCLLFSILLVCPFAHMFANILYAMLVISILLLRFAPFCYYLCISPFPLLVY